MLFVLLLLFNCLVGCLGKSDDQVWDEVFDDVEEIVEEVYREQDRERSQQEPAASTSPFKSTPQFESKVKELLTSGVVMVDWQGKP